MKTRRLACESLEPRQLMAVASATLSGKVLKINMDNQGGDVHVSTSGSKVLVKDRDPGGLFFSTPTWSFNKGSVTKIEFRGGSGDDYFDNDAFIPVEAWGKGGNDELNGGNAADILHGGEGNDKLLGIGGNDRLYGDDGRDQLFGGDGHDSLFGGGEDSVDQLTGGAGRDRFLTQPTDVIKDASGINSRSGEDAQLKFVDRDQSWSNREIEIVDDAFAQLFAARGDNRLLKETRGTAPLTFYQGKSSPGAAGHNQELFQTRGCWYEGPWYNPTEVCDYRSYFARREIVIVDWNESSASANANAIDTVIHEIGHNYEDDGVSNATWESFKKASGWVQNPSSKTGLNKGANFSGTFGDNQGWYRSTNDRKQFARGYGGVNPYEDFATVWELYFNNGRSTSASNSVLKQKLQLIEKMIKAA